MGKPLPALAPSATCLLQYSGQLVENAHAAVRPIDHEGHFAPALCFTVALPLGSHIDVQQYFPSGHDEQCKAAAAGLRKGEHVTFQVSLAALRLQANGVSHVERVSDLFAPAALQAAGA